MPELPEVEAARSAIANHCINKTIVKAVIANDTKVINGVSPSQFEASLINKTIVAAHRKGKNLWLHLDSPPFPSFQFGMTGAIYIKGVAVTKYKRSAVNDADEWPSKFSKFFIELNDGLELSFTDPRRFAKVRLLDDPASVPPISELGPDALLEPMIEEKFYSHLHKKNVAIKTLLLDQSFISGIGNWVADEVLYQARIHPSQNSSTLTKDDSTRLQKVIKEVIEKAVEVGANSSQYPSNWIYHSREQKSGKAFVDGKKIDFIVVGSRTTAYVPAFQKLTGEQAKKDPSKPRKQASKKTTNDDDDNDDNENDDNDEDAEADSKKGERENLKSKPVKNSKVADKKKPTRKNTAKSDGKEVEDDKKPSRTKGGGAKRKSQGVENNKDGNKSKKSRSEPKASIKDHDSGDGGDDHEDQSGTAKTKGRKTPLKRQTRKKAK